MNKKIMFFIKMIIYSSIIILFVFPDICLGAGSDELVEHLENAFKLLVIWIVRVSTPAAAVAVGTGIFMQKFSFGEEERIRMGKKIVRTTLFSYGFILVIDMILSAIQALLSA